MVGILLNVEAYNKKGVFRLSSGKLTDPYYDLKEAMGEPSNLQKMFAQLMPEIPMEVEVFIGLDYGGIPLALVCSLMTGKPYAVLRKKKKEHGTEKRIEGWEKKGRAVVLDDVENTGETIKEAVKYLKKDGYDVIKIITVMKRKD